MTGLKVPPHSIQAEQSVIGGLMLANDAIDDIEHIITADDFYRRDHREIYHAIMALHMARQPFDVVVLADYFAKTKSEIDLSYLGTIAKNTPSAANIEAYANIVHSYAIKRALIAESAAIADAAYSDKSSEELLSDAQSRIGELADHGIPSGLADPKDVLRTVLEQLDVRHEAGGHIHGLATGFADLDKKTSGMMPGNLIIIAGRPSMGKSTIVGNICEHVAVKLGHVVQVQSVEMPKEMWMERSMCALSGVSSNNTRTGDLDDHEWGLLTKATSDLANSHLHIDDTAAISVQRVRSNARKLKRKYGRLCLIVVDYMQLMRGTGQNREQEISSISRDLKALAKEMECPVIALSQLNRSLEQRANKRPILSDLRESGSIEQDADLILFVYRDEVYNPDTPDIGTAEVIIGKNRQGPVGMCRLAYQGDKFRFKDYAFG